MDLFRASVEARRRGEEPPENGYQGDYVAELATLPDDPGPADAAADRADAWSDSGSTSTRGRSRASSRSGSPSTCRGWIRTRRTAQSGRARRRTATRTTGCSIRSETGTPTYRAADVVYLADKLDRGLDRAIYVLGADHHGTRNWYAAVARMLGYDPDRVEVLLYQLVHLTRGGAAAKMSKRRGDVVFLDELLDEVGVDATRWYLVSRGPDQTIEIDVDLAAEKSQKNPVYYVQYAHARIAGILRNAGDAKHSAEPPAELADEERDLIKRLAEFPAIAAEATERRGPHAVPTYAIRLADDFHRFYHEHKVLGSDAEAFRLGLVTATSP